MPIRDRTREGGPLWLNAVEVLFPSQAIPAAVARFEVNEFHRILDQDGGELVPVRLPDGRLAIVPLVERARLPGAEIEFIPRDNLRLFAALVREAVFRHLRHIADERGIYRILSRRPPAVETQKDFGLVDTSLGLPPWLTKRVVMTFDTRTVHLSGSGARLVLTCSQRLRTVIGATCAELLSLGFRLQGCYVSCGSEPPDPALDDRLTLAGRVVRIEGDQLYLDDNGNGPDRLAADEVFLEPTKANFALVVETLTQGRAEGILAAIEEQEAAWRWGGSVRDRCNAALGYLRGAALTLARGVPLELGPMLGEGAPFPPSHVFPKPTLSFDPGGMRNGTWSQQKLDEVGPYDRQTFPPPHS